MRNLGWLLLSSALAVVAYRDLLTRIPDVPLSWKIQSWLFLPTDSAAPVVVVLSLWLLYRRRARLRGLPAPGRLPLAAALLAAGASVFLWSTYTGAADLLAPSLLLNALGFAALFGGTPALRAVLLPAGFLIFAMPIPGPLLNEVLFRLQIWTAEYSGWLLRVLGFPALVAGELIVRPSNRFAVIENCSGLRSMETLAMIAVLMGDLFRRRRRHVLLLALAALPVAFALNGLRVVALILNPRSELIAIHNLQGVAILLGGLLVLYLLDGLLALLLGTRRTGVGPPGPKAAGAGFAPGTAGRARARARAAAAVLAGTVAVSFWLPSWQPEPGKSLYRGDPIPSELGPWRSAELETDRTFLGRTGFRQIIHRRYWRGADQVDLFAGFGEHSDRLRSPFSPKIALPGSGWIVEQRGVVSLEPDGLEVRAQWVRSSTRRLLVYHWYEGTRGFGHEVVRSLLALDQSPLRRPRAAVAVRISTEAAGSDPSDRRAAEERLLQFSRELRVSLNDLRAGEV